MRTGNGCYRVSLADGELHESTLVYADFHHINSKIPTYTNGKFIVGRMVVYGAVIWREFLKYAIHFRKLLLFKSILRMLEMINNPCKKSGIC